MDGSAARSARLPTESTPTPGMWVNRETLIINSFVLETERYAGPVTYSRDAAEDDPIPATPDLAGRVGRRIRRLRQEQDVTLSKLAKVSGLGKGTLSELENGRRNPTLETLVAITSVLDASLSSLLQDDSAAADRDRRVATDSGGVRLLLSQNSAQGRYDVFYGELPADPTLTAAHPAGVQETVMIVGGNATVGPQTAPRRLSVGEVMSFPADVPHVYHGDGGDAVAIIVRRYPL